MKKLLIVVFLTIAFSIAGLWAINQYNVVGVVPSGKISALNAIPQSASFIIEVDDLAKVESQLNQLSYGKLLQSNNYYSRLIKRANEFEDLKNNLILKGAPDKFTDKAIVSTHIISGRDYDFLTVLPEYSMGRKATLKELESAPCESATTYLGVKVHCYQAEGNSEPFYIANSTRLWLVSSSAILVEDAIKKLESASQLNTKSPFQQLQTARSANTDLTVYMNAEQAPLLLALLVNEQRFDSHKNLAKAMDWMKMDIDLKADKIVFNGKAVASKQKWLNHWREKPTTELGLWENLRQASATLSVYNLDDFKNYANKVSSDDDVHYFQDWVGSQWAVWIPEIDQEVLILSVDDMERANASLTELHRLQADKEIILKNYADSAAMNSIDIATPLNQVFQTNFEALQPMDMSIVGQYIIVGQKPRLVREVTQKAKKVGNAKSAIPSGNVKLFLHPKKTKTLLHSAVKYGALKKEMVNKWSNDLGEVSMQFSRSGSGFNTQGVLTFGEVPTTQEAFLIAEGTLEESNIEPTYEVVEATEQTTEVENIIDPQPKAAASSDYIVWEKDLGKKIISAPSVLKNHRNNENILAVQSHDNVIHVFSRAGQELFTYNAGEKLLSPIYQLDYFKNGKLQMVFNTATKLHMIDILGRKVKKFPISLPSKATGAMQLVDYDQQKNYRLFVPTATGIYGYRYSGQALPGWGVNSLPGHTTLPLQHFSYSGKDYLAVTNKVGEVIMMNRKGEARFPKVATGETFSQPFKVDTSVKPYRLVGKSVSGKTYTISLDGQLKRASLSGSVLANAGNSVGLTSTANFLGSGKPVSIEVVGNKLVVKK